MIRISITTQEKQELQRVRKHASSVNSEKILMVLMNSNGDSAPVIAKKLKRNAHTVRDWLKRYKRDGIKGLERNYSPGRPADKRELAKEHIKKALSTAPKEFGYLDSVWSVPLIAYDTRKKLNIDISEGTVTRALSDLGYSYKRPAKTVSKKAPTKEEKANQISLLIDRIKSIAQHEETEIYALDESHFSTEPYLVRGWFKKRWTMQDRNASKAGKSHILWMLEFKESKFLLEKISKI